MRSEKHLFPVVLIRSNNIQLSKCIFHSGQGAVPGARSRTRCADVKVKYMLSDREKLKTDVSGHVFSIYCE